MYQQQNGNVDFTQNNKNQNFNKPNGNNDEKPVLNLPDILRENLDIVVVGITPSGMLGVSNHHFSGPGNHFWRCITEVGMVSHPVTCEDDTQMLDYGIGFISFCTRPNKGTTELSRKEMKIGAGLMVEKIKKYKPKIVVFNGIGIYEAFIGNKNFSMGLQPNKMEGTDSVIFVMPSSSARCAQLPRAEDKIPFFVSLKKLRDHMRGDLPQLEEKDVVFENYTEFRVTQPDPRSLLKAERRRKRKAELNAEHALQDNVGENSTTTTNEESKSKKPMENEIIKDERNSYDSTQTSFSSSIQNQSTIVNSSLLSWPQNGGLTIIHTGQPIIMPTNTNPTAQSNTLLLLDPTGLSFSSIPVPMNSTQLQVRPMILPTDNEQRISTTAHLSTISSIKPIEGSNSFANFSPNIKARPPVDIQKTTPVKSTIKVLTTNENSKSIIMMSTGASVATSTINSTIQTNTDSNKPIAEAQTLNQTFAQIEHDTTPVSVANQSQPDKGANNEQQIKYNPLNDPNDEWELFMNGIFTGEFAYPAPPQTVPVQPTDAIEEYEILSQFNVSRILTVL